MKKFNVGAKVIYLPDGVPNGSLSTGVVIGKVFRNSHWHVHVNWNTGDHPSRNSDYNGNFELHSLNDCYLVSA